MNSSILENSAAPFAHRVTNGLLHFSLAVKSRTSKEAGTHRISPTQAQILALLHSASQEAPTLSFIARWTCITAPTASEAVLALAKNGLVRKVRSNDDARKVAITLSAKGRRKAEQVTAWTAVLTEAAGTLTPAEQKVLVRALSKMIEILRKRDERAATAARPAHRQMLLAGHAPAARQTHECAVRHATASAPLDKTAGGRPSPSRRETP